MDRAYRLASSGQTVELAAGDYPAQLIKPDPRKTSAAAVTFAPAAGAHVHIAGVAISASHIELRDLQTLWRVAPGADGITFRNVSADGAVYITGASNVSVLGGEIYSPVPVSSDSQIASFSGKVPTNILFDGVSFHDFLDVGPGELHHIECLQVGAAINLTIRDSKFQNCATHDIFIRSWGPVNNSPSPLSNILIENNWFAKTAGGFYAMQFLDDLWTGTPATSVTIRNNSALQSIVVRVSHGTAVVHGNIIPTMAAYFCDAYGQKKWFDYNVYGSGVPCGPHDRIGDPKYVDSAKFDLHLQTGSAALDRGDPLSHPTLDIDGKLRPIRGTPDAGATQRESADITLGKSIGSMSLGATQADIVGFYGPPRRTVRYRASGQSGTLATYLMHGGKVWILYNQAKTVVGIGTTSPYYSTLKGDGVSAPARRLLTSLDGRWLACQKAYRKNLGSVAVYIAGKRQARTAPITSVWMVRRSYDGCGHRPR